MVAFVPAPGQLPLIQFVESDDLYLQDQPDVLWADVLPELDYRRFQATAEGIRLHPILKLKPQPHSG